MGMMALASLHVIEVVRRARDAGGKGAGEARRHNRRSSSGGTGQRRRTGAPEGDWGTWCRTRDAAVCSAHGLESSSNSSLGQRAHARRTGEAAQAWAALAHGCCGMAQEAKPLQETI
jgi:hypothetical protein